MSRTGRPAVDKDGPSENREMFQEDDYGTVWKIKRVNAPRAHILAHSMGNRALIGALLRLYAEADQSPPRCPSSQIILVAADVKRSHFEKLVQKANETYSIVSQVGPDRMHSSSSRSRTDPIGTSSGNSGPHFRVYCSIEGKTLALSRWIHGWTYRLGDTRSLFRSTAADLGGHDVIDTTGIEQGTSNTYHSYHLLSSRDIADIQDLLKYRTLASESTSHLHEVKEKGKSFYAFEKESRLRSTGCVG